MPSFEEARRIILENIVPLGTERVQLLDAPGRILAEEIAAPWDMPLWDNSAMDGYALRETDCRRGALLEVVRSILAGGIAGPAVEPGTAVRIMTGAPVPPGTDTIIPVEETEEGDGWVKIAGPVAKGEHIRVRGEDMRTGETILPAGTLLRAPQISMLASFSHLFVPVYRRPRVAIVSTGDELVEPGEPLTPGNIVNSNTPAVAAALREIGVEPVILGIARDTRESHREKISAGLAADALITSAGVADGDRDIVRETLAELGVRQLFWKVDMKPGRPTAFGLKEGKPVFCLPGNPVATIVSFEELVRPALLKMMGHRRVIRPFMTAVLHEEVRKKGGRLHFLRVKVERNSDGYVARTAGDQNTGILRTMVQANGLAVLASEATVFPAGSTVPIHLLDRSFEMEE